jgi:hypothetical protein
MRPARERTKVGKALASRAFRPVSLARSNNATLLALRPLYPNAA